MSAIPTRAVIYGRYSSDKQNEQSIEGQLRICKSFAEQNNLIIVNEYIDRAMSGTSDRRPAFQQMISDSTKNHFQIVLVWKLDRFARNRYDSAIYEHKLEKNGVRVVSVTENIGDGNEALILKSLLQGMAEFYSKQLAQNVKRGMRESAMKANSTGGAIPLGYKMQDKKLVIDPETAPIVKYVFEEYANGAQKMQIIRKLSEKGYRKANGKDFTVQNITYILNNVKYIGVFSYTDIQIEDGCPALISKEIFDKCKSRAEAEKKHYGRRTTEDVEYLLMGKLFCGYCGKPMAGDCGTSRNGERHHYYTCFTRKNKNRLGETCQKKSEKKGFIEWFVVNQTVEYVLQPKRIEYIADKMVEYYHSEFSSKKVKELEKELNRINKEIDAAVSALIKTENKLAIDKINEKLNLLETQKSDTEVEISKLNVAQGVKFSSEEITDWLKAFCSGDALDVEFQKRIIKTFVNSIYLYDDHFIIYYNLKDGKQVTYIEMLEHSQQLNDDKCSSNFSNVSM